MLRAATRHDNRIRDEVVAPPDEVAANRREPLERPSRGRLIAGTGLPGAEVLEKLRERLLPWPEEDGVRVRGGLLWKRRHVQTAKRDEAAPCPVGVRQAIRAVGVGDVDLDHDQIRRTAVVDRQRLDVLVFDRRLVVGRQVRGERRQAERWEERILDWAPEGARRFGQRRQDEPHSHTLYCKVYSVTQSQYNKRALLAAFGSRANIRAFKRRRV